jgi:hypothetical protein
MQVIKHAPNLYEIPNFLAEEELSILDNIIANNEEQEWFKTVINTHGEDDYWLGKVLFHDIPDSITHKINALFRYFLRISPLRGVQRLKVGEEMPAHLDSVSDKAIQYGVVVYLNDNFTGGATIYPDLNLAIQPKRNHLILHDANHLHGAAIVESGSTRYILSCFVRGSDEQPVMLADMFR